MRNHDEHWPLAVQAERLRLEGKTKEDIASTVGKPLPIIECYLRDYEYISARDKARADLHFGQVKAILARHAFRFLEVDEATQDEDDKEATDMVVSVERGKIAVRIRKTDFRDLTIRAERRSGRQTEHAKLLSGFGDWYLYCWLDDTKSRIIEYILVDLHAMRESGLLAQERKKIWNKDEGSAFYAYPWPELSKHRCLVAHEMEPFS